MFKYFLIVRQSDNMARLGKKLRLSRIFDPKTKTTLICPMDHAIGEYVPELADPREIVKIIAEAGANAFMMRRGLAQFTGTQFAGKTGLILRITASTGLRGKFTENTCVSTVEEAVRLGADAVGFCTFVGSERETTELRNLGLISDACDEWGMPLLGEMIPIGGKDVVPYDGPYTTDEVRLAVRTGAEEGADFIKTYYTGDPESFREVVKYSPVPIVIAGGPREKDMRTILERVKGAMDAGAAGISMGRKLWGYKKPAALTKALAKIIREKASVEEAIRELEK